MSHSNSSLNCFQYCMAKYKHNYILRSPRDGVISPHLTFGSMAHDVLYKAGQLRDDYNDNLVENGEYYNIIPSEILHGDLKDFFQIRSWEKYFTSVIKQVAEYENDIIKSLDGQITLMREVKLTLSQEALVKAGQNGISDSFTGIIDLLVMDEQNAIIVDYKFSTKQKTQDDFDLDSQLPLYAFFVHHTYGIPLRNIRVGYIDIPKQQFGEPTILTNGTLSRAKDQNVSSEFYKKAVEAIHGDDPKYNCEPGGYYYDIYCNLSLKKAAYINLQYIDSSIYNNVISDLFDTARLIETIIDKDLPFVRQYSAYTCKNCEYLTSCKPYLGTWGG